MTHDSLSRRASNGTLFVLMVVMGLIHVLHALMFFLSFDGCTKCIEGGDAGRLVLAREVLVLFGLRFMVDVPIVVFFYLQVRKFGNKPVPPLLGVFFVASAAFWLSLWVGLSLSCGSDCDPPSRGATLLESVGYAAPFLSVAFYFALSRFIGELGKSG